jgi:LTXXQ motif family protein
MTRRFVKLLAAAVALGAFIYLTEIAAARHGGGGGGWHGGGRAGGSGGARIGGGHFGGMRAGNFSAMRVGGIRTGHFSGMRMSGLRAGNFNSARINGLRAARLNGKWSSHSRFANLNGKWTSHNRFANLNGKWSSHNRFASLNGKNLHGGAWNKWGNNHWHGAWNKWGNWHGGWNGRWGGWYGPVFWPFFYGDLLSFVFWPYGFYDPFWAYGDIFVWDAILWPGPYTVAAPGYYDVYGDYGHGRTARTRVARNSGRDVTGSISDNKDLAQICGGLAPGVSDLPIDCIEKTIQLSEDQLKALDALKAATSKASDLLKGSCASEVSLTPLGRLETVQKRIDGMIQALAMVRAPLDNFYNSLNDEQKQRFAALGSSSSVRAGRQGSGSTDKLAQLCSRQSESFTQLPVQRIEQAIKPTQQQQEAFERLKAASVVAANQLQSSCPKDIPQTPLERFDAVGQRLDAMSVAIKLVQPALASFYSSLTDEQKARFNILARSKTTMNREG